MVYPLLKNKAIEDNYAITSQDIVDGLNRVGAAAKNAGMTIEETIGALTVLREASGRTGKEVGTALNTIFSYMTRNKTINLMESLGIRVFEDEARTTFRSVIELMEELAARWQDAGASSQMMTSVETELLESFNEEMATAVGLQDEWNDMQQRDISQAAAGVRRRNFFISLMSRFSDIQGVVNTQLEAEGYSMRENERTMATLAKQWEALKAAAERFAVAIGDAGLLEELKRVVVFSKDAVEAFNNMDDSLQTLLITFAEITIAIKLFAAVGKMAGISGGLSAAGGILAGWSVPIAASTSKVRALTQATTALTTVLKNVGKATLGAFGGPYVLGITLAATAITALVRNARNAEAALIEQGAVAEELIGTYDQLHERLGTMQKGSDEYNATLKELADTEQTIAQALPSTIEGWDEQTQALIINREEMERLIEAKNKLKKSHQEEADELDTAIAELEKQRQEHEKEADYYETQKGVLQDLANHREELTEALNRQSEGSEEHNRISTELGETERLIGNIAQEAGEKRVATIDKILKALDGLIEKERQAASNTKIQEAQKTQDVINNTGRRLQAINAEIRAQQAMLPGGQWYDDVPGFLKGKYNVLPGGEFWTRNKLGGLQEEAAELQSVYDQHKKELDTALREIDALQREVLDIDSGSGSGGGTGGTGSSGAGKSIDAIAEALERLADSAKMFELVNMDLDSALEAVNQQLGMADAEFEYLNQRMEYGAASAQDYARMQELVAFKMIMLEDEQRNLTTANEVYQKQMEALKPLLAKATSEYERFKAAGDAEHTEDAASAIASLKSEMDGLSSSIADNTAQLWQNKSTMEQLTQSTYTQYYQSMTNWMNHMEAIGRMTTQQQLEILQGFEDGKLAQQDEWQRQEEMYQHRRDLLNDEMDRIKDAYDERMEMYEEEVEANERLIEVKEKQSEVAVSAIDEQIKAIQRLMDLLDDEGETEDREESERQHNQKIADLIEERQYHEVRTGREHLESIDEINREIAEENRRWQLQQNDWARDDQKDAYQDQIDSLREKQDAIEKSAREEINRLKDTNNRKKQEMQKYYNELQGILNDHNLNMLATVGGYNDQMFQKGLELMRSLADGMQAGRDRYSLDEVDDFFGKTQKERDRLDPNEGRPIDNTGSGSHQYTKDQAHAKAESARRQLRALGYSQGVADISSYDTHNGTLSWYNQYIRNRTDLTQNVKNLFKEIVDARKIWTDLDQAHTGAYVGQSGVAELLKGERVLSPQMTLSFDRLSAVLGKMPDIPERISVGGGLSDKAVKQIVSAIERRGGAQINGPAVNIEHAAFEGRYDGQALGVDVRNMITAKG